MSDDALVPRATRAGNGDRVSRAGRLAGFAGALGLALLTCFAPLNHDEHMYVAAGVLVRDQALYTDFAYLQAPYLPYLYAAVFPAAGTYYLLAARLVSLGFGLAAVYVVYGLARVVSKSRFIAALATVFFASHHLTLLIFPYARNHVVALALIVAALACCVRGVTAAGCRPMWSLATGALAGAAVGMRLTQVLPAAALLASVLCVPRSAGWRDRLVRGGLPLLAGLAFALLPAIWIAVHTRRDVFVFDNLGYHQVNAEWSLMQGAVRAVSLPAKLFGSAKYAVRGSGLALLIAFAVVAIDRLRQRKAAAQRAAPPPPVICRTALVPIVLSLAAAVLAALLSTPLLQEYLAFAVPFLALALAVVVHPGQLVARPMLRHWLSGLAGISLLVGAVTAVRDCRGQLWPPSATPFVVHADARRLGRAILEAGAANPKVATLAPIYALEGGLPIYRELATGPFLYRLGDLLTAERRRQVSGVSPGTLAELLARDPPAAIAVFGCESGLEDPFVAFAESHGYVRRDAVKEQNAIWLRPCPRE
jgi:4-amino-4-deoxy-L-arabinose transferase-like glycosyltransferase